MAEKLLDFSQPFDVGIVDAKMASPLPLQISNPSQQAYVSELLSFNLERLHKEPELLRVDGERIQRQMQEVVVGHYRAFIGPADAVRNITLEITSGHDFAGECEGKRRRVEAQHLLRDVVGGLHSKEFVNLGDVIPVVAGYLRGHGTQPVNEELLATVCGVVERVNKLVSVRPLRARYNAETGDVVVGRVTEVGGNRWKVDVNSRKDAELLLAAVNLPGGIQRRRTAIDELNMRDLYVENDLISAEVQSLHQDGSLHLHTRSLKYGKLGNGQLVRVAPYLIKRLKQHFHQLKDLGVDLILGCNGFIWISAASPGNKDNLQLPGSVAASESAVVGESPLQFEARERICRLANSVRVLGALGLLISPDSIMQTYEASLL